jgi:glycosyl transferase family 2
MTPLSVSVVVPVYNGGETIEALVSRLTATLVNIGAPYEIILVNDGSHDESWSTIKELTVDNVCLRGIDLMRNFGQHNAVLAGVRAAVGEVIVTLDDDLQHPPEAIPTLLDALEPGIDLVYGAPTHQQHSWWRNAGSVGSKSLMTLLCGWREVGRVTDFRAFRTTLREGFARYDAPAVSFDALLASTTQSITSVSIEHAPRRAGRSNYRLATLASYGTAMATSYSARPLRLITLVGSLLLAGGAVSMPSVLIVTAATGHRLVSVGFVVALTVFFAGIQLLAIGVVGEYVGRVHFRSLAKPTYLVRTEVSSSNDESRDLRQPLPAVTSMSSTDRGSRSRESVPNPKQPIHGDRPGDK